ncbi:MAG: type II toxin-antitoxin system VapC family toxin [Propionibacteriaceae bacterium]|nr:type II toxin-antitoxin system VapC family toxin [Propionibacteriaceae bacterium]
MLVVDASVLATALADDGRDGDLARRRLLGEPLAAPQLIDLEVVSVLRRLTLAGQLPERRSALALADLVDLPVRRAPHTPLLKRCWELRANVTAYDAAYVALAEMLDAVLVTTDERLARASGLHCTIEVLHSA